jgi:hypothetical protein
LVTNCHTDTVDELWDEVVGTFRRACVLRHQGQVTEARTLLENSMPRSIARWSQVCAEKMTAKRELLNRMFADEQKRVEDASVLCDLLSNGLAESLIPSLRSALSCDMTTALSEDGPGALHRRSAGALSGRSAGRGRPRRVPVDDVAGMIDALLVAERCS